LKRDGAVYELLSNCLGRVAGKILKIIRLTTYSRHSSDVALKYSSRSTTMRLFKPRYGVSILHKQDNDDTTKPYVSLALFLMQFDADVCLRSYRYADAANCPSV
jgi:hypothetical protein